VSLIREERLIAGVNFLEELSPKLRQSVLLIKDKVPKGTTVQDAETLAAYSDRITVNGGAVCMSGVDRDVSFNVAWDSDGNRNQHCGAWSYLAAVGRDLGLSTSLHRRVAADGDALAIGAARDDPRLAMLSNPNAEGWRRFVVVDAGRSEPRHHHVGEVCDGHFLSPICLSKGVCRGGFLRRSIHRANEEKFSK